MQVICNSIHEECIEIECHHASEHEKDDVCKKKCEAYPKARCKSIESLGIDTMAEVSKGLASGASLRL